MKKRFGISVFDFSKLEKQLPPMIYRKFRETVDQKKELTHEVADFVAREIKKWAESVGATHYTHWFLPLTGLTAGKQNSFLDYNGDQQIISRFSGRELIKDEPDASSFPHGGMRSTFEARGYTAWDPASPVFVVRRNSGSILYIPSVFFGYNGSVLDKKTPLLRSLRLINRMTADLIAGFDTPPLWVKNMVGPEQEFFLIDENHFQARADLGACGRVIFAARPPRGQQMGDHYFGNIPEKVMNYLEEVEQQALELGIPIKTRHNEVAPNQFEVAPLYEEANIASDHNQILMDLLTKTARRHHMVCLLHEKPFPGFNGSGKHLNWSLMDNHGHNLLTPGKTVQSRLIFAAVLAAFVGGLKKHNDLLQAVLVSPGNELRLGGNEAPPAIVSVYLGKELTDIINNLKDFVFAPKKKGKTFQLESFMPGIRQDLSDRNRTSPVAFTGNKFEIRMAGSSASLAFPIAVVNTIVADGMAMVISQLKGKADETQKTEALSRFFAEHGAIIYEGNNYSSTWPEEAKKRGLYVPTSLPASINRLCAAKNIELFEKFSVLSADEVRARADIKTEIYVKTVEMELRVARFLLRGHIIPAALKNQNLLLNAVRDFPKALLNRKTKLLDSQLQFIEKFTEKINTIMAMLAVLDEDNEKLKTMEISKQAQLCSEQIRPHIEKTAFMAEKLEERVDRQFWSIPKIMDILFR